MTRFWNAAALAALLIVPAVHAGSPTVTITRLYSEGDVLPGQSAAAERFDYLEISNSGYFIFGGDTLAADVADEFMYRGQFTPLGVTLLAQDGASDGAGFTFGRMDQVNDVNESGNYAFVSETNGSLDALYTNAGAFIREGDLLLGETLNSLHQPQIDGAGQPWYFGDIGADSSMDVGLFAGTTLIMREGGTINGVPVATLVISESSGGSKLHVNDAGDYILQIDQLAGVNPNDDTIIFNGNIVAQEGDDFMGMGPYVFFDQCDVTENGRWWVQAQVNNTTAGPELLILENQVLVKTGDSLGGGLSVFSIQTGDVNSNGDWIAAMRVDGAPDTGSDDVLAYNGQVIAREGDPFDSTYTWGTFGFVNDVRLNDNGQFVFVANLVDGGGNILESLFVGSVSQPVVGDLTGDGCVDLSDLGVLLGCWQTPCGDLDNSGNTDLADLGILLANWQSGC